MNTEMKQFEVVNDNELVDIFGGYSNADCLKDYGKGILAGAVGGGLACTGGKLGGR